MRSIARRPWSKSASRSTRKTRPWRTRIQDSRPSTISGSGQPRDELTRHGLERRLVASAMGVPLASRRQGLARAGDARLEGLAGSARLGRGRRVVRIDRGRRAPPDPVAASRLPPTGRRLPARGAARAVPRGRRPAPPAFPTAVSTAPARWPPTPPASRLPARPGRPRRRARAASRRSRSRGCRPRSRACRPGDRDCREGRDGASCSLGRSPLPHGEAAPNRAGLGRGAAAGPRALPRRRRSARRSPPCEVRPDGPATRGVHPGSRAAGANNVRSRRSGPSSSPETKCP